MKKILVINCGSSPLKFELFEIKPEGTTAKFKSLAGGIVDRFGKEATFELKSPNNDWQETLPVADQGEASRLALEPHLKWSSKI
jgi:acetate kinase